MLGWFIMGVITIASFIAISLVGVSLVSATGSSQSFLETQRRLTAAQVALEERMGSVGELNFLMPVGVQGPSGTGYRLPTDLPATTATPFGRHFVYCPFGSPAGVGGASVAISGPDADGSADDYTVGVQDGFVVSGRPAAFARVSQDPDLMGFILAPIGRDGAIPSCDAVTFDAVTGQFSVPNGAVRAISRVRAVAELRNFNSKEPFIFISPTGTAPADRSDAANPTSMDLAAAWIEANRPNFVTVNFLPGTYARRTNPFQSVEPAVNGQGRSGRLSLVGSGSVIVSFQVPTEMTHYGSIFIRGINFGDNMRVDVPDGSQFSLVNSRVGSLIANGSEVYIENSTVGGRVADASTLRMNGGRLQVASSSFGHPGAGAGSVVVDLADGAVFQVVGGNLSLFDSALANGVAPAAAVRIGPNSGFSMQSGTIGVSGAFSVSPFVVQGGRMDLVSVSLESNIQQPSMLVLSDGARLVMQGSFIGRNGVRPAVNVRDLGASFVSGRSTSIGSINGGSCWTGPLFALSPGSANANRSVVGLPASAPVLSDPPTKGEIVSYRAWMDAELRRQSLALANTSDWTCEIAT